MCVRVELGRDGHFDLSIERVSRLMLSWIKGKGNDRIKFKKEKRNGVKRIDMERERQQRERTRKREKRSGRERRDTQRQERKVTGKCQAR